MSTTAISDLYGYVRSILGDHGVWGDDDVLIPGTLYWQNATILAAIQLVVLDTTRFSISNSVYVTPQLSNNHDLKVIIYSAALVLILPERDQSIRTPHYSITKNDMEILIGRIYSQIENSQNSGLLPYAKDGSLQHLYNLSSRMADQVSGITDPDASTVIPNDWIEVRNESGDVVLVDTDLD